MHSGLHRLFDALRQEAAIQGPDFLPTHRGEMNFCLRGCYVSAAKTKFLYRKAEATVARAEKTGAVISAGTGAAPPDLQSGLGRRFVQFVPRCPARLQH